MDTLPKPRGDKGFIGMRNQGLTCHMNSLLTSLAYTPEFKERICAIRPHDLRHSSAEVQEFFRELQNLVVLLYKVDADCFVPDKFFESFGVNVWIQEDVHEDFTNLMSKLSEALQGTADEDLVDDLFRGRERHVITCTVCGYFSTKSTDLFSLFLYISGKCSVESALEGIFKCEVLNGDDKYQCPRCNKKQEAERVTSLEKTPKILVLVLNRAGYNGAKCHASVKFSTNLDVGKHVPADIIGECTSYELQTVIVHEGEDTTSGHYSSIIRDTDKIGKAEAPKRKSVVVKRQSISKNGCKRTISDRGDGRHNGATEEKGKLAEWYEMDDHEVEAVHSSVLPSHETDAYLLIYRRKDLKRPIEAVGNPYFGLTVDQLQNADQVNEKLTKIRREIKNVINVEVYTLVTCWVGEQGAFKTEAERNEVLFTTDKRCKMEDFLEYVRTNILLQSSTPEAGTTIDKCAYFVQVDNCVPNNVVRDVVLYDQIVDMNCRLEEIGDNTQIFFHANVTIQEPAKGFIRAKVWLGPEPTKLHNIAAKQWMKLKNNQPIETPYSRLDDQVISEPSQIPTEPMYLGSFDVDRNSKILDFKTMARSLIPEHYNEQVWLAMIDNSNPYPQHIADESKKSDLCMRLWTEEEGFGTIISNSMDKQLVRKHVNDEHVKLVIYPRQFVETYGKTVKVGLKAAVSAGVGSAAAQRQYFDCCYYYEVNMTNQQMIYGCLKAHMTSIHDVSNVYVRRPSTDALVTSSSTDGVGMEKKKSMWRTQGDKRTDGGKEKTAKAISCTNWKDLAENDILEVVFNLQ